MAIGPENGFRLGKLKEKDFNIRFLNGLFRSPKYPPHRKELET